MYLSIIVGWGFLTPLFYEDPLYCLWPPPFFNNFPVPLPRHLQPAPLLLFLLSCFFVWMGDRTIFDVPLNDIMDLHMSNLGTRAPERPCCVFYAIKHQVDWDLRHVVFTGTLIWSDKPNTHTNTHTNTQLKQGPIEWHTHINIYNTTCYPAMSSQRLSVLHWIIHWYQKFTIQNVFSFQKSLTCRSVD